MDYRGRVRWLVVKAPTIALTSPGIVNCLAWTWTGRLSSRSVAEVIGPIEARSIPSRPMWRGHSCPRNVWGGCAVAGEPSKATKLRAVDELVNVTTWGRRAGFFNAARKRLADARGTIVSYASTTSTCA